jgi:hypothetical protein
LERVLHTPTSGRRPRPYGGVWDTSRWSNLPIRHITKCAFVPTFTWSGACKHIVVGLPLVIDCISFFLIFSLLTTKMQYCYLFVCWLLGSGNHVWCQTQTLRSCILNIIYNITVSKLTYHLISKKTNISKNFEKKILDS